MLSSNQRKQSMKTAIFAAGIAAFGLAAAATPLNPALAQAPLKGGLYAFHSRPIGKCPGLDWHVMVEPNGALDGYVAWDRMPHLARLSGTLTKDRTFEMAAQEVGGAARKATVKGTAAGDYITASITGSGSACDDQVLQIPRAEGGLEGGGG